MTNLNVHSMDAKTTAVLFVFLLLVLIYILLKKNRPKIPGPFPWPIIGNAISLGSQPHRAMQSMAKKYGPIFMMKLGGMNVLVLNDYSSIKEALGRQKHVFEGRPQFDSFTKISQGKGIVFNSPQTQGKNWRKLKNIMVTRLHKFVTDRNTRTLVIDQIKKETIALTLQLHRLCQENPHGSVEPETMINVSVANIACAFIFGHRYDYNNKEFQDLVSVNRQFGNVVSAGSQVDVMPWIKVFPPFRTAMKTFHFLTDRLNNWMYLRSTEHRSSYVNGITRDLVDTFITSEIENPQGILQQDTIVALTTDLFGAAQDTLSTIVQWIFAYMMYFPEVQKKVQFEIDSVLGYTNFPDEVPKHSFPYSLAVLHEICRHSSFTATTIPHTTTAETVIGGYHVPKGMLVFINQFAANHDPKYWDNPSQFQPERFLDSQGCLVPNAHDRYLLFSYGSRKCPGDELTRMLLLHFTVLFFNLCEVESDPRKPATLEYVFNLSSRPKSLVTKFRIRKPELLQQLLMSSFCLSPNIPIVNPKSNSLQFVDAADNAENELPETFYAETLEFSDEDDSTPEAIKSNYTKKRKSSRRVTFWDEIEQNCFSHSHSSSPYTLT